MFHYCIFDQLPVELLHTLFSYFSASELLLTFYNVSIYVNDSLECYSNYQIDLKSISKSNFRRICRHIQPEQVISLTLTDSNDTSGQTDLFFSHFQIQQFIRLRSLTLIEIEFNSLKFIFSNLSQLHQLRSLSFNAYTIRHKYDLLDLNSYNKLNEINSILFNTYTQIFPQLYFLHLNGNWILESIPLPNLLYLKLGYCPINKLERITHLAPKLKSLNVCVNYGPMDFEVILLPFQLTRLTLKFQDFPVSMNYIECLLSNRLHLKYLELQMRGHKDITNGERWQILTKSLITFNFKFNIHIDLIELTLHSFRTYFWLEEKQWFIAYQDDYLFSIPYFAPEIISTCDQSFIHSTAPNNTFFYKNITKINTIGIQTTNKYFTHRNFLELNYSNPRIKLSDLIDLHYVTYLSISYLDDLLKFPSLEHSIPCLRQLFVLNEITIKEIKHMIYNVYRKIRILEVKINNKNQDYIIEKLFQLFPYTEQFIYKSDIQSIELMGRFIDGFKHLLNASFISFGPLFNQHEQFLYNPNLIILKAKRPTYGISICRIYHLRNDTSSFNINWWIEE